MALEESEKEEILDAVAEQIADLVQNSKSVGESMKDSGKYLDNMIEIKQRVSTLETKVEKRLQDFEIIVSSFQNQFNDKLGTVSGEKQKDHAQMIDQMNKLRTGLIKLSNEIKEIKVQLALKKT